MNRNVKEEKKEKHIFNMTVKKEFYSFSPDIPTIGLVMMVKNEKKRLQVTLDSIVGHVDCMIIFDTGSTDNTIDILKAHSEKHKINLYLIEGEFVNFSTSRNMVLDFADTIDVKFLLLMDTNDELQGGTDLRGFSATQMNTETTGYLVCQHWWSGHYDKYFNVRFVKNRSGWRYQGRVHEWMKDTTSKTDQPSYAVIKLPDHIILYQDRTKDDDKTVKRFKRDYELLLEDHKDDPTEPRTLFYLAQTCSCLEMHEDSLYYYKLRSELEGFQEEKFHAFLRAGELSVTLGHNWTDIMGFYMKAAEHSDRAEPYIKIAKYYIDRKKFRIATGFAQMACDLEYPYDSILFVDKRAYDYERWHILGLAAFYAGRLDIGKKACIKAVEAGVNKELDESNLRFYIEREKEETKKNSVKEEVKKNSVKENVEEVTKAQFVQNKVNELKQRFPHMKPKQLRLKANMLWKKR